MSNRSSSTSKITITMVLAVLLMLAGISACAPSLPSAALSPTATPATTVAAVPTAPDAPQAVGDGVVHGWAVLAEKDYYSDVGMTDLRVDYITVRQVHQLLLDCGWQESRIRELRGFAQQDLRQALGWLAASADEDDLVLLYVTAHGRFLERVVEWGDFFAAEWDAVSSQRRVLVVDSCLAAKFTAVVSSDPRPHLSVAAVDADEYGWSGLEEEGLPIIGGVFSHYFVAAFGDSEADADGNGAVSVQEAALHAEGQQRVYMHEVVFAVPEFAEMYEEVGSTTEDPDRPHVVVDDAIGTPLYLELDLD